MSDFAPRCSQEQFEELFSTLSNQGRWGVDDEIGTLNYITPEKVAASARLIQAGQTVSLGLDISSRPNGAGAVPPLHHMLYQQWNPESATDFLGMAIHGFSITHLDALCHKIYRGMLYNGIAAEKALSSRGAKQHSILAMKNGLFTRGVLLDVARSQRRPWLEKGERVHVEDLEQAEEKAGLRLQPGDVLVMRTGEQARVAVEGFDSPYEPGFRRTGLDLDCLPWLGERQIALYTGDCCDCLPSGIPGVLSPLHLVAFVALGLPFLDNLAVEELSAVCADLRRWEFVITLAPLRISRGTGSPVNPLAVF